MTSDHFPTQHGDGRAWDWVWRRICLLATERLIHLDLTFSDHHIITIIPYPSMTPALMYTSTQHCLARSFINLKWSRKCDWLTLGLDFIKENPTMPNKLFGCDRQKVVWWMKTFLWMMAARCQTGEEWCLAGWRTGSWRQRPLTWRSGRRASLWTQSRRGQPQSRDPECLGRWRAWEMRERRRMALGTLPPPPPGWRASGAAAACSAALTQRTDWTWPSVSSRLVSARALKWKHEIVASSLPTVFPLNALSDKTGSNLFPSLC